MRVYPFHLSVATVGHYTREEAVKSQVQAYWYLLISVCLLSSLATTVACIPGEIDSLVTVNAPSPAYRFQISKHIRGSELWRAYLEQLSSEQAGNDAVVSIDVQFERKLTEHTDTGDYDAGVVHASLECKELVTGNTLLVDHDEFEIPNYVIVKQDATREEVQDEAFASVEDKAVRYITYSLDLALLRAMGRRASEGMVFITVLEDVRDQHWSLELKREAETALRPYAIRKPAVTAGSPSSVAVRFVTYGV